MAATLRLFIAGKSTLSLAALRNFSDLMNILRPLHYRFEIIDVVASPEAAELHNILVTPVLVETLANGDGRRFIGDLSEARELLASLQLAPVMEPAAAAHARSA